MLSYLGAIDLAPKTTLENVDCWCLSVAGDSIWAHCLGTTALAIATDLPGDLKVRPLIPNTLHITELFHELSNEDVHHVEHFNTHNLHSVIVMLALLVDVLFLTGSDDLVSSLQGRSRWLKSSL